MAREKIFRAWMGPRLTYWHQSSPVTPIGYRTMKSVYLELTEEEAILLLSPFNNERQ